MDIKDFRRDPIDRLLMVQCRMANCDAFLTTDSNTIWRHRAQLKELSITVVRPTELWDILRPFASLWL